MKLSTTVSTDNITELLVKIIEFTQHRQKVLTENINRVNTPSFKPKDLEVNVFSDIMNTSIVEHARTGRLMLIDSDNIKFGCEGTLNVKPVDDICAAELLDRDQDEYLEYQINKLLENSLNQRVAAELLRQKQQLTSAYE